MSKQQTVTARAILRALAEVKRKGERRIMEELEKAEPDLAEYAMESLSQVYHDMLELGAPVKQTQRLYRQIEVLVLVCVIAVRKGR